MTITIPEELKDLNFLVGMDFPEADEDALWRCATAWAEAADRLRALAPQALGISDRVLAALGGEAGAAFGELWSRVAGEGGNLGQLADACEALAAVCDTAALETEYAKMQYIAALVLFAMTLAALAAAVVVGGISALGVPAAVAAARYSIAAVLARLVASMAVGAAVNVCVDGAVQSVQTVLGHRAEWDWAKTRRTAEDGLIFGAVGAGVFLAGGRLAPGMASSPGGVLGLAGATGAVGGVAAPLAHGETPTGGDLLMAVTSGVAGTVGPDLGRGGLRGPDPSRLSILDRGDVDSTALADPIVHAGLFHTVLAGHADPAGGALRAVGADPASEVGAAAGAGPVRRADPAGGGDPSGAQAVHASSPRNGKPHPSGESALPTIRFDAPDGLGWPKESPEEPPDHAKLSGVAPPDPSKTPTRTGPDRELLSPDPSGALTGQGGEPDRAQQTPARDTDLRNPPPPGQSPPSSHGLLAGTVAAPAEPAGTATAAMPPVQPGAGAERAEAALAAEHPAIPGATPLLAVSGPDTGQGTQPGEATRTTAHAPTSTVEASAGARSPDETVWPLTEAEAVELLRRNAIKTDAGLAFYPPGDDYRDFARAVRPTEGFVTLDLHGSRRGFHVDGRDISPIQLAAALRALIADGVLNLDGRAGIKLLSCETAYGGQLSPAARLARELGVPVIAPDRPVWTSLDGEEIVASPVVVNGMLVPTRPPDGSWQHFQPTGAELSSSEADVSDFAEPVRSVEWPRGLRPRGSDPGSRPGPDQGSGPGPEPGSEPGSSRRFALDWTTPGAWEPSLLIGADPHEIAASIPESWVSRPTRSGGGVIFADSDRPGRQIRIMPGYPAGNRPDAITRGPYLVISENGRKLKIPLLGNATLVGN